VVHATQDSDALRDLAAANHVRRQSMFLAPAANVFHHNPARHANRSLSGSLRDKGAGTAIASSADGMEESSEKTVSGPKLPVGPDTLF
jgi:hypothetical protein